VVLLTLTLLRVRLTIVAVERQCVLCIVGIFVTANNVKILNVAQKLLLLRINVAGNDETYLGLHIKCLIFLPDFDEIWSFWADFYKSSQYQISRISVQWGLRWCMQTDRRTDGRTYRHDETNRRFSRLCERAYKSISICLTSESIHLVSLNLI
jgi:hypothetical protein